MSRSKIPVHETMAVSALLLIAALARFLYHSAYLENVPYAIQPLNDAQTYWDMGLRIYRQGWLLPGDGPFYQAPLYPYFLALLHQMGYHHVAAAVWIQALLGLFNTLLVYGLGRAYFSVRGAFLSALLFSLSHYTLFHENKILAETLGLTLFLLFSILFLIWIGWKNPYALAASALVLGLAALARPNLLFTLPFLAAILLIRNRGAGEGSPSRNSGWIHAAGFVFLFALTILPATLRNGWVGGDWGVPICANSGVTLYMGTNDTAQGGLGSVPGLSNNIQDQYTESIALASQLAGRPLKPSEASSFWVKETIRWVVHHPFRFATLEWKKLLWAVYCAPPAVNYSTHFEAEFAGPIGAYVLPGVTLVLVAGGWAGLWVVVLRRREKDVFLAAVAAGYLFLSLVYYASDRFLAGMMPFLAVLMVLPVYELRKEGESVAVSLSSSQKRLVVGWILLAILLALNPTLGWNARREVGLGWYNLGVMQAQSGDTAAAQENYEKGLEAFPDFPPLLLNLGVLYAQQGRLSESTRLFEHALELDPRNETARRNLEINRQRTEKQF